MGIVKTRRSSFTVIHRSKVRYLALNFPPT
jgi:hypothetical protein